MNILARIFVWYKIKLLVYLIDKHKRTCENVSYIVLYKHLSIITYWTYENKLQLKYIIKLFGYHWAWFTP